MTSPLRGLPPLAHLTARRLAWPSVVSCFALAVLIAWLISTREHATAEQVHTTLRWSAVLLAGGVATAFDDPTEDDLSGAPVPLWWRRVLALLLVTVPTTAGWAGAILVTGERLPWVALSIEAAALILLGCAVASTRPARRANVPAGLIATVLPSVVLILGGFLPRSAALLADPGDAAGWRAAHLRWAALVLAAVLVLAFTARDRARRPALRALRAAAPPRPPTDAAPRSSPTATDSLPEAS